MEQVTFEEAAKELVVQLESILGRMALAADSGVSTYSLEGNAKKLAAKIKASADIFKHGSVWKDIGGSRVWSYDTTLPDSLFGRYTKLVKSCGEELLVFKAEEEYFAQISDGLFIKLSDLPGVDIPKFKVKVEGNVLMAVRADLYDKLPSEMKKLIGKETNERDSPED